MGYGEKSWEVPRCFCKLARRYPIRSVWSLSRLVFVSQPRRCNFLVQSWRLRYNVYKESTMKHCSCQSYTMGNLQYCKLFIRHEFIWSWLRRMKWMFFDFNNLEMVQTDAIFCKTETWTHLPSRDVWNTTTSWVRIPNACLVIEGASPISEILFDSGLHIGLHENTGRNCWCSSSIGGMESLPFSAWDWVAEHPRMQPNTIFFNLTTIQLDYTDAPLRDSKCLWLRKLQWVAESTSQIASNPYWIVVILRFHIIHRKEDATSLVFVS